MKIWFSALTALAYLSTAATAQAQTFPTKSVTIVVTAAAGGVTDIVARAIGQRLSEKWGQQVIIENKGGGAHVVGAASVANAAPDGHTLMLAEAGTYVINPVLYAKDKLPFDIEKDFIPITGLVRIHHALVAAPSFPAANLLEVIDAAKQKPGQLTYGTAGIGSGPHVNMVRFENVAKIKLNAIHYRGATPAFNDVMGDHTSMMLISVSSALPTFRERKVKMYGIGSAKRLPQVPDVPTLAEAGNLPGFLAGTWFGLAATGRTPQPIIDKINKDVREIMAEPSFKERFMTKQLYEPMDSSPAEFKAYIHAETQNWAKVIKEQNLVIGH